MNLEKHSFWKAKNGHIMVVTGFFYADIERRQVDGYTLVQSDENKEKIVRAVDLHKLVLSGDYAKL